MGEFADFPAGLEPGTIIPANFGTLTPLKRWTIKPAFGVSYQTAKFQTSGSANQSNAVPAAAPAGKTPAPVAAASGTPAPVTPAPVTPHPVTPAPVTPAPVTPAPSATPPVAPPLATTTSFKKENSFL